MSGAAVSWRDEAGEQRRTIDRGYAILAASGEGDAEATVARLAAKVAQLRTFPDAEGRSNLSIQDVGGAALVVSQFTLYADLSRGRRPSFLHAGDPAVAERWVDRFAEQLQELGVPTQTGRFGAQMLFEIANDGPVTYALSSDDWPTRV